MVHFLGNQSFDNLLEVEPSERESGLKGKWFLNFIRHNKVNGTQNSCFNKYHNWNYLYFLNSSFNKSTTKQVKVFIFLFEKKKNFYKCVLLELRRIWQALSNEAPPHWPYSTWISATCCALWTFRCFLYYYLLHASLCFTNPWHAKAKDRGTTLSFIGISSWSMPHFRKHQTATVI